MINIKVQMTKECPRIPCQTFLFKYCPLGFGLDLNFEF